MSLSPHTAPALSDDDERRFGRYRIGGATGAGRKTLEILAVIQHFP